MSASRPSIRGMSEEDTANQQHNESPPPPAPEPQGDALVEKSIDLSEGARGMVVMPMDAATPIDISDLPSGLGPAEPQGASGVDAPLPSEAPPSDPAE
jgi:hypothetical protein